MYTISYRSYAMGQNVGMVESVGDLETSRSIKGTPGPDIELLDARIASALNKIIQSTRFMRKRSDWGEWGLVGMVVSFGGTDRLLDLRIFPGHWGQ